MYDPDCLTDSKVLVNGERIPVGDVDIHIRNEGYIDIARYVEVNFFSPFRGTDFLDVFNSVEGTDGSGMDEIYIEVSRYNDDTYFPAFRGVVTGVGNAGGDTPSQMWTLRAQGPAMFLDKVPVSSNFEETGAQFIVDEVGEDLADKLPFDVTVADVEGFESEDETVGAEDDGGNQFSNSGLGPSSVEGATSEDTLSGATPNVTKTFKKNRDTLADVLQWISKKKDALLYFIPRQNDVKLQPYFGNQIRPYDAHYLGGNVIVMENNALSELSPINTLTVNGKAASTISGLLPNNISSGEFAQVKVRHEGLYERAGETELHPDSHVEDDALKKKATENAAKKMLREKITEATGGDMETLLFAPIAPYDTIRAKPVCEGQSGTETDPITYNISRVHHQIRASDLSTTKLNVGVAVGDGDIEVVQSGYKES